MAQPLFELVAERGPDTGRRYPLNKPETYIGREPTCEVPLQDEFASRRHAKIVADAQGHIVVNMSPIGVAVNAKPAEKAVLHNGDQIDLGPYTRLRYQRVETRTAAPADTPTRVYTGPPIPAPGATTAVPRSAAAAAAAAKPAEGAGRARKLMVGFGVYVVLLAGLFLLLSGLKGRNTLPEPRLLTPLQIEEDLKTVEVPLPANDDEAGRWRQEAKFLSETSRYDPEALYQIYAKIRGVARYERQEPVGAMETMMNRALKELVNQLYEQYYRRAYVADRAQQTAEAIAHYRRLRRMVPNHRLKIYEIAVERERLLSAKE